MSGFSAGLTRIINDEQDTAVVLVREQEEELAYFRGLLDLHKAEDAVRLITKDEVCNNHLYVFLS